MSISFESALGIHEKALKVRSERAGVLANNDGAPHSGGAPVLRVA